MSEITHADDVTQLLEGAYLLSELMPKGRWCIELHQNLQPLIDDENLLSGFCYRPPSAKRLQPRLCFFATSRTPPDVLRIRLLHIFLPIYVSQRLNDQRANHLPKPLLDGAKVRDILKHPRIEEVLKQCQNCHRKCGKMIDNAHDRLVIVHEYPETVATRLFEILGCFEIILVDRIQLLEESGELIREGQDKAVGTAAGFLSKIPEDETDSSKIESTYVISKHDSVKIVD